MGVGSLAFCLLALILAGKFIYPMLWHSSTDIRINFSGFQHKLDTRSSLETSKPLESDWDCGGTPPYRLSNDWILKLSCVRAIIEYSHPVRQFDKSPSLYIYSLYQFCSFIEPGLIDFPFPISFPCPCSLFLISPMQKVLVFYSITDVYLKCRVLQVETKMQFLSCFLSCLFTKCFITECMAIQILWSKIVFWKRPANIGILIGLKKRKRRN